MPEPSRLVARIDGKALSDDEARELWKEFSVYMDENRGDLDGFAKKKGWASVVPTHHDGRAVLLVSTTAAAPKGPSPTGRIRGTGRSKPGRG